MEETKEFKVSVVTAVYNVKDYLEEMIESIIAQNIGFEYIQLILVDDGSTDGSSEICDQYALQYPDNIVVIHKKNGGVSSARNEGLNYVKSEFVNFTDSDDKLYSNALKKMYDYLKEKEDWIDFVAIPLKFFGTKKGEHALNYRFKKTRIVDMRKNYDYIQLSMSGALIKTSCFDNRRFDSELAYTEDAQIIIDILLEKMRYGVVSGTGYLYRKRETCDSAVDLGRSKVSYYIPTIEKFILYSLKNAIEKKGYIPQFVQYTCMYDLQWRLNQKELVETGVLNKDDEEQYKCLIINALQYIDNKIIMEQKNLGNNYKMAIMSLKEENKALKKLEFSPDDLKICIGDISSINASTYTVTYEFIEIQPKAIVIEGYVRYFKELDDVEIVLKMEETEEECSPIEYIAEVFDRNEKCSLCLNEVITEAKGFRFNIKKEDLLECVKLFLCLRYQENEIVMREVLFGKFFPLANQLRKSYFFQEDILLTYSGCFLKFTRLNNKNVIKECEKQLQKEIFSKNNKMLRRGWVARNIYHCLKRRKKREIWLISDRLGKADDNGEAFFTYMNTMVKDNNVDTYFVLDKNSEDYERLRKVGKVVSFHSTKHKILSLLCDKIISSQAEEYYIKRFYNLSYLYKDIQYHQKFIFLQHGVTKDNLSRWLAKSDKNISMFVTVTRMEYQSILEYAYYYNEKQVKCTGFPRYDYLYDNAYEKNIITFMPTWRSYLTGKLNEHTDSRPLKGGFEHSSYCQMYQQVFSSNRLFEAAKKYHYDIKLMLHPSMPSECLDFFNCNNNLEILDRHIRYRDLFAQSKLIVTDYSSTVFDFAYLRKPVVYYQQDVDEFFSGKHTYDKGYFDYERDGFGEVEYTAETLIDRIIEYMKNGCQLKTIYSERITKTFPYNDKDNCKRVYEEIIKL